MWFFWNGWCCCCCCYCWCCCCCYCCCLYHTGLLMFPLVSAWVFWTDVCGLLFASIVSFVSVCSFWLISVAVQKWSRKVCGLMLKPRTLTFCSMNHASKIKKCQQRHQSRYSLREESSSSNSYNSEIEHQQSANCYLTRVTSTGASRASRSGQAEAAGLYSMSLLRNGS